MNLLLNSVLFFDCGCSFRGILLEPSSYATNSLRWFSWTSLGYFYYWMFIIKTQDTLTTSIKEVTFCSAFELIILSNANVCRRQTWDIVYHVFKSSQWLRKKMTKHLNIIAESNVVSYLVFFSGLRVDYVMKRVASDLFNFSFMKKILDNKWLMFIETTQLFTLVELKILKSHSRKEYFGKNNLGIVNSLAF